MCFIFSSVQFSRSVVSSSLWPLGLGARQDSLSITNFQSLLKLMSIEAVMLSNHLILCHLLLLLPSIFPSIRVFFSESVLCIRWPKYWSFSFSIIPSKEIPERRFATEKGSLYINSSQLPDWPWTECAQGNPVIIELVSAKELMLLNHGVREDAWESLGQQGDPTSPS